jgi:hypothetical protein
MCPVGRYSSSGATECIDCLAGFVSPVEGATTCTACSAGYYAPSSSLSNCSSCPAGKFQDSTGQSYCSECGAGKYSGANGRVVCSYCTEGRWSTTGSDKCNMASTSYYLASESRDEVNSCPSHAECLGGVKAPLPDKGFWVDHSDYKYAGELYRCARSTCKGGTNHSSCWTVDGFKESGCNQEQCIQGAKGPLCSSCSTGWVYNPAFGACELCSHHWIAIFSLFGSVFVLFMFVVAFLSIWNYQRMKQYMKKCLKYIDSGTLKVLWVTYQIVVSASFTLNITVSAYMII